MSEQWIGNEVIMDMHTFLDVANQTLAKTHTLFEHLDNFDNLVGWAFEECDDEDVRNLILEVSAALIELKEKIQTDEVEDIALIAETKENILALEASVKQREFHVAKKLKKKVEGEAIQHDRATQQEIKDIHSCFINIMRIVKASGLLDRETTDKRLSSVIQNVYMLLGTYENIFRDLLHKEQELEKVFKQD
ncbi:MAG: hypothetical protein QF486_03115 [Candidatus Woesearchaeota archaeon]|jgi:hypothetical protein|nr:hypothetical protein [Candidatus Woesearchaeota archaeon]MDP7181544.1 hypothetical protein [Candidatus Woesearchaeota archaeon]MDP7198586.1 hypothetical protein [Candidatus Woesearchaeota archaeon]MDP7466672.1 hypothetical protein [Candidatus Woesearchaeota archaeon]|tara:strand:- start:236 stop:811 length:576 start_codon:yes stop_codon:yes gene_type:complete